MRLHDAEAAVHGSEMRLRNAENALGDGEHASLKG